MIVAKLLSQIFKKDDGIILIDHSGQKYICGKIKSNNPITLKLLKKNLNWKLILNPDLEFAEAYMRGDIIIENASLLEFLNLFFKNLGTNEITRTSYFLKKIAQLFKKFSHISLSRTKSDVQHHYDFGGEKGEKLYDLFLDKKRYYSCAYWKSDDETLEQAQQNKVDHIIKKLGNVKPGSRVIDLGCGWGGMAFELAKQKGCEVTGISLSKNQIEYCKRKAKELKLDNQVTFELKDYREIKGKYDYVTSIGAWEHFLKRNYLVALRKIYEILNDKGVCVLHTIGSILPPQPNAPFIQKWIFPNGEIPHESDMAKNIEKSGLIMSDRETLIRHYDKTLESWLKRFLKNKHIAKDLFDQKFVKMWEFYLASCSAAFKYRDLVVFQYQLVKNFDAIPSNRRDYIYT